MFGLKQLQFMSANIVKAERRTSNLFECYAEAPPIFAR